MRQTSAGRAFLPEARAILRLAEDATLAARRVTRGDAGNVPIGFTASSGYRFIPELISRCGERLPDVELTLEEMVTTEQVEAPASGRLDIALLRPHSANEDFKSVLVASEPLVAALPETHPPAQGRCPTLMDFDRQPFVMYSPIEARYFHDLVTAAFSRSGVIPRYTQCTSQIHSILALVRGGLGTAPAPEAPMSLRFDGVVCRPLRRAHSAPAVELYMAWKKEDDNPARRSVLDTCLQHCQSAALTRPRRWPRDGAPAPAARI